jgi:hypothetical protein
MVETGSRVAGRLDPQSLQTLLNQPDSRLVSGAFWPELPKATRTIPSSLCPHDLSQ